MIEIKVEDAQVLAALQRLIALGRNPRPVLRDIAALGESSTRMRFRTETGPDGKRWQPLAESTLLRAMGGSKARTKSGHTSARAIRKLIHKKILTQDGHLSGSLSSGYGRDYAEWGVNRVYAAMMQFGGTKAKFPHLWGDIPARPYLGVSDTDKADILDIIQARIQGAAHAG